MPGWSRKDQVAHVLWLRHDVLGVTDALTHVGGDHVKAFVFVSLVGVAVACAPAPGLDDAHRAAIQDSVADFLEEFRSQSAAGVRGSVLELYVDDASLRWVEDGQVRYRSIRDIADALGNLPPETRIETSYDDVEIMPLAPGTAWTVMRFRSELVDSTGVRFGFGGAITMVLSHRPRGWQIVGGHVSSPRERQGGG